MTPKPTYDPPEACPRCGADIDSEVTRRIGGRIAGANFRCADGCGYERSWRPDYHS